jgi:hypothetical protein
MQIADVLKSAGRLTVGVARTIGASAAAFKTGAHSESSAVNQTAKEREVYSAVRLREATIDAFAKAQWYAFLILAALCMALGAVAFAYEVNNVAAMGASGHLGVPQFTLFGYHQDYILAVILMSFDFYFTFLLFFSKKEIPFWERKKLGLLCALIGCIVVIGNFTALQKRDISSKKMAENQARIAELAKANQAMTARVVSGAEKLAKDAGETRTPSLMRAGAKAVTDAAEAAAESSKLSAEAMRQLSKAPPPTNEDVQGQYAKVFSAAMAIIIFWGGIKCFGLAGFYFLRAREEYVITRSQVRAGASILAQSVGDDDKPIPAKPKTPRTDPAPSASILPLIRRPRTQFGGVGTDAGPAESIPRPAAPPKPPAPAPAPRIDPESIPAPESGHGAGIDPTPDLEPHRIDPSGRVTYAAREEIDPASLPLLRLLLDRSDITALSNRSAAELLRSSGVSMSAERVARAMRNLHGVGLLENAGGYHDGKRTTPMMAEYRANAEIVKETWKL